MMVYQLRQTRRKSNKPTNTIGASTISLQDTYDVLSKTSYPDCLLIASFVFKPHYHVALTIIIIPHETPQIV